MDEEFELLKKVDEEKEELIHLVQDLVRIPSENTPPSGKELECQEYIARYMVSLGLSVDLYYFGDSPELKKHPAFWPGRDYSKRPNLAVVYKGKGNGKSLLLSGHIDTVPRGSTPWKEDPFGGVIKGNNLYGLGAWDMKGGIGAIMIVLKILKELDVHLQGDLIFESVVDEEFGGVNGTIAGRLRGYNADGAIITEPTNLSICPATCGCRIAHITLKGKGGIMDEAYSGSGSVMNQLFYFLKKIKDFAELRKRRKKIPNIYQKCNNPVPVWITKINMGGWGFKEPVTNPESCKIELYWQTMPGENKEDIDREFFQWLKEVTFSKPGLFVEEPQIEFPIRWMPGAAIDETHPLVSILEACAKKITQREVPIIGMPSPSDLWVLPHYFNIPALHFGAGGANAHLPDEYVKVNDLLTLAKSLLLFIIHWCGLTER